MRSPRGWLEPTIFAVICLVLAGGFWFAWHHDQQHAPVRPVAGSRATPGATPPPSAVTAGAMTELQKRRAHHLAVLQQRAQRRSHHLANQRPVSTFTFGQFNVLGAVHTRAHGEEAQRPSGDKRTPWMYQILLDHHVDVGALQEFERSQQIVFHRIASGTYDVWPGLHGDRLDAENSVIWRKDRFSLVRAETRAYPYFNGRVRNMPRVLLRDRTTGVEFWVTSYHNPATTGRHRGQLPFRHQAMRMETADARALLARQRHPLVISGDMNERDLYFCTMAAGAPMHAANGGSVGDGCHPPRPIWIDWIWGSRDVAFSDYRLDRSPAIKRASDHPIVTARVAITGLRGERPAVGTP